MAFSDVSGNFTQRMSLPLPRLRDGLIARLQALQVDAQAEPDTIAIRVPLLKSVTRGFVLQGIACGQVQLVPADGGCVVQYQFVTLPMRLFCIALPIFAVTTVLAIFVSGIAMHPVSAIVWTTSTVIVAILGYMVGTQIVAWKFRSFVRSVASEMG